MVTAMPLKNPRGADFADVISAIGTPAFGTRLLGYLHGLCGAEHCVVYGFGPEAPSALAAGSLGDEPVAVQRASRYLRDELWRRDPSMTEARARAADADPALIRLRIDGLDDIELRDVIYPRISERVVVCGRSGLQAIGFSAVRSVERGNFSDAEVERIRSVATTLLAAMAKHAEVVSLRAEPIAMLQSLPVIEQRLQASRTLPRREAQVCARLLYGMPAAGVAVDLGIGEESVKTYRKRAYRRLGVGGERELLRWYLAHCAGAFQALPSAA